MQARQRCGETFVAGRALDKETPCGRCKRPASLSIRQGKHIVMSNGLRTVTVPRHTTINALTMGKIARDAGYTPEQFRALL